MNFRYMGWASLLFLATSTAQAAMSEEACRTLIGDTFARWRRVEARLRASARAAEAEAAVVIANLPRRDYELVKANLDSHGRPEPDLFSTLDHDANEAKAHPQAFVSPSSTSYPIEGGSDYLRYELFVRAQGAERGFTFPLAGDPIKTWNGVHDSFEHQIRERISLEVHGDFLTDSKGYIAEYADPISYLVDKKGVPLSCFPEAEAMELAAKGMKAATQGLDLKSPAQREASRRQIKALLAAHLDAMARDAVSESAAAPR